MPPDGFSPPSVIITAAHALLYMDSNGQPVLARHARVIPGRNGPTAPFGVFDSTVMRVSNGWLANRDPISDYGAIRLDQPVGNTVGWLGCGVFTDAQIATAQFNLLGFPSDKPPVGSMWGESGPAVPSVDQITYGMSTYSGQSGAPLYAMINGNAWAAGIHSGGQGSANYAVRITAGVLDELMTWKA